jgi:hypothetical protein
MSEQLDPKTRRTVRLVCRDAFVNADNIAFEAVDYSGYRIKTTGGEERIFLLRAPQIDATAVNVTADAKAGRFMVFDR